jgi:hypothetical protein
VTWPEPELDLPDLAAISERAFVEKRTSVALGRTGRGSNQSQSIGLLAAVPLGFGSEPIGVAGIALATMRGASSIAPESIVEQLRWGTGWLEALLWARKAREATACSNRAAFTLDIMAVAGEHRRLESCASAVVNELTAALRCDRVSLGLSDRKDTIRLRSISQSTGFQRQSRIVEAIEKAMQEAVDQNAAISLPALPATERAITLAHRSLLKIVGATSSIMTVVVPGKSKRAGAFVRLSATC